MLYIKLSFRPLLIFAARRFMPKTTKLLHDYMISKDPSVLPKAASKDKRKNLVFLMKLSNFIKKD